MKALRPIASIGLAAALVVATGACTLTIDPREADRPAAKQPASAKVARAEGKPREFRGPGRRGEVRRQYKGDARERGWRGGRHGFGRGPGRSFGRHGVGRHGVGRHDRRFIGLGLGKRRTGHELSVDEVHRIMAGRLAWRGNKRLKLGKVEATGDRTIVVEVVTVDNSLVSRMHVDRESGRISWPD